MADHGNPPDIGTRSMSFFLRNLEQWIDEKNSQDGLTYKELIKTIKETFERAIEANIEYHRLMAKSATESDYHKKSYRHKLMAKIYQSLLHVK